MANDITDNEVQTFFLELLKTYGLSLNSDEDLSVLILGQRIAIHTNVRPTSPMSTQQESTAKQSVQNDMDNKYQGYSVNISYLTL